MAAKALTPAQPAEQHLRKAIQAASAPRLQGAEPHHQPKSAVARIDVHIGAITLTVRAPAPAPAPSPQAAPRAEPRPAFSASRHYLRCP